jgi:hypothetical protein
MNFITIKVRLAGRKSEVGNFVYVCARCNLEKHAKDLEVFLTEQTAGGRTMQLFDQIQIYGLGGQISEAKYSEESRT